jgi:Protein of unknown function (DUF3037)
VTPLREGGSLPALVEAGNLGTYVMKFRGAGQGSLALVAEIIAGELSRRLGLRVPELVLGWLDPQIAVSEPDPEIQDLLRASEGLNLGVDCSSGTATSGSSTTARRCTSTTTGRTRTRRGRSAPASACSPSGPPGSPRRMPRHRYLEARIELDERRLLALDPAVDLDAVRNALAAFGRACTEGPLAGKPLGDRFRWLTAPRSTIVQPGPVHSGLTADPAAELTRLFDTLVRA